MFEP
jgi:hypothetical protein